MPAMEHPAFSYVATEPRRGAPSGRLNGWSIPVKDSTPVAGFITSDGNPARARLAKRDDPLSSWLLEAGAEIPAHTLTSELGATCYAERPGVPVLESPAYPGCTPGGSSAGAGVAVALGLVRAAHGTDAGGSIRVPAAACNVVGFKAAGRHPRSGKVGPAHGFLTRNVADQVEVLGWRPPEPRQLRIGVITRGVFAPSEASEVRGAGVEKLAALLGRTHDVVELAPYPEASETFDHFSRRIKHAYVNSDPLDNAYLAWLKQEGETVTPAQLAAADEHARALPHLITERWGVDAVLSPTIAFDPPKLGYFPSLNPEESFYQQTVWSPWCSLFNMTQAPAIALGPIHIGAVTLTGAELLGLAAEAETLLG